jgi:hypothetical protein
MDSRRPTCVTGGARGADACWVKHAHTAGHNCSVYWPNNVRHPDQHNSHWKLVDVKTPSVSVKIALADAAECLHKNLPQRSIAKAFIYRDAIVAQSVNVVYAVGYLKSEPNTPSDGVDVLGGTGWTLQVAANRFAKDRGMTGRDTLRGSVKLPIFLWDMNKQSWLQLKTHRHGFVWRLLSQDNPISLPKQGAYAGIGSREITDAGQKAIQTLFTSG